MDSSGCYKLTLYCSNILREEIGNDANKGELLLKCYFDYSLFSYFQFDFKESIYHFVKFKAQNKNIYLILTVEPSSFLRLIVENA